MQLMIQRQSDGTRLILGEPAKPPISAEESPVRATKHNLEAMIRHRPLHDYPHEPTLRGDEAISVLHKFGYTVDETLSVLRKMNRPFVNIRETHIRGMIATHLVVCHNHNANPGEVPIFLHWHPGIEDDVAMVIEGVPAIISETKGGVIGLSEGKRVVLNFEEWYLVPQNSRVLSVQRGGINFDPIRVHSVNELCTAGYGLTDDGHLIKLGENKLEYLTISVDDLLK